jgi:tripartite-type tricarboxylate transporter receptor subunit TctC
MSYRSILKVGAAAVMAGALAVGGKVAAQVPQSPITLVVGVAAGGSTDVTMRAIATKIEEMGGPRFVIENRGGGGGIPAAIGVRDAPPDGRTLFVASYAPFVVSRAMSQNFAFDPTTDFRPITTLFTFPLLLMVPAEVKAKSVAELVALSKSRPSGITYGSQGVGTAGHLLGEMFAKATGANLVHVPYKGASQAVIDLVAGRLDMMFIGTLPTMPHVQAGKLRPLAATAGKRLTAMPDVPTFAELGHPDINTNFVWFGIAAPRKTPDSAVRSLHQWLVKAVTQKDLIAKLDAQGIILESSTPEAFVARINADYKRFEPLIKASMKQKQK